MISFAPRFLSLRHTASITMSRNTPSNGNPLSASVRSMVLPSSTRPRRREPINFPASSTASAQLRVGDYSTSSLKNGSPLPTTRRPGCSILSAAPAQISPARSLPTSHLFAVGTGRNSSGTLDICSHQTSRKPDTGHLLESAMSSLRKSLISRPLTPPRAK